MTRFISGRSACKRRLGSGFSASRGTLVFHAGAQGVRAVTFFSNFGIIVRMDTEVEIMKNMMFGSPLFIHDTQIDESSFFQCPGTVTRETRIVMLVISRRGVCLYRLARQQTPFRDGAGDSGAMHMFWATNVSIPQRDAFIPRVRRSCQSIALHSQVITEYCKWVGASSKLRGLLIRKAKRNGDDLGFLW